MKWLGKKTRIDGILFDSKAEAGRYGTLRLLERAGEISGLEVHPRFPIVVAGVRVAEYRADFRYLDLRTSKTVVEDVKGVQTREYRLKKKLVEALYAFPIVEIDVSGRGRKRPPRAAGGARFGR